MEKVTAAEIRSFLEDMLMEYFDVIACDDTLDSLAAKLNDTWSVISNEELHTVLQEEGFDDIEMSQVEAFNEDLYNKLTYQDLEV